MRCTVPERDRLAAIGTALQRVRAGPDAIRKPRAAREGSWPHGSQARSNRPPELAARLRRGHMEPREPAPAATALRPLRGRGGVCDVEIEEEDDAVTVCGFICAGEDEEPVDHSESCDCPVHVYLERPLGERVVIGGPPGRRVPYRNVWEESGRQRARGDDGRVPVKGEVSRTGSPASRVPWPGLSAPALWVACHRFCAPRPHAHASLEAQPRPLRLSYSS